MSAELKCPQGHVQVRRDRLHEHFLVCPECGYHHRLTARERLSILVDPDSFREIACEDMGSDPLGFIDTKPYTERLRMARLQSGEDEAVLCGTARIHDRPLVIAVMDFGFIGGSMGSAVGRMIALAAETAIRLRVPLLTVAASGGARMQEGCYSLMQMATTSLAIARLSEARIPYLSILTDPTYGGVTASFASLGDVLIAEPGARIGFAGKEIVASTTRRELPADFQTAEYQLKNGMLDMVVPRSCLRERVSELLGYYQPVHRQRKANFSDNLLSADGIDEADRPADAWDIVQASRHPGRPTTQDYIGHIFDSFQPLQGDRLFGDDPAVIGGLARLGPQTCMVIGTQRGSSPRDNHQRNYGMPHPEGFRKSLRLMRHAARFEFPIVTFVDTLGAHPGEEAEQRGQAQAIAQNLFEMSRLPVPIVAVITGQGGSGGALALAFADRVLMLENAYYSVITPESCSLILFKNLHSARQMARNLQLTAFDLKHHGVVDRVLPEPPGGAHTDFKRMGQTIRGSLIQQLRQLTALTSSQLVQYRQTRYARFDPVHLFEDDTAETALFAPDELTLA